MGSNAEHEKFDVVLNWELRDIVKRRQRVATETGDVTLDQLKQDRKLRKERERANRVKKRNFIARFFKKTRDPEQEKRAQESIDAQLERARKSKLVGLALSGGGVRAGAVSLGLLQSLYHRKLLGQFDYMSTVSGGGYAGTYLTTMFSEVERGATVDWQPDDDREDTATKKLDLALGKDRGQSEEMRRLIYGGIYLRKFRELVSTTMFGVVVNWTMILAGLTALTTLLAIFYRLFDMPAVPEIPPLREIAAFDLPLLRELPESNSALQGMPAIGDAIEAATYAGDIPHALVPSLAIGVAWLGVLLARILFRGLRWRRLMIAAQSLTSLLLIGSLLCAVVLIVNTGQLNLATTASSAPRVDLITVQNLQYWTWFALVTAIVVSLLPFLRHNALAQSGAVSAPKWQGWMVKVAVIGMLAGVPLVIFGIVVDENLFGFSQSRDGRYLLTRSHVKDWIDFNLRVKSEAQQHDPAVHGKDIPDGPADEIVVGLDTDKPTAPVSMLDRIVALERKRREIPHDYWLVGRWLRSVVDPIEGPVPVLYRARRDARELEGKVVERINELLKRSDFYTLFPTPNSADVLRKLKLRGIERDYAPALANASELGNAHESAWESAHKEWETRIQQANRRLLDLWYADDFFSPETVFSHVVWTSDQWNRLCILLFSAGICLTLGLFINVNMTSAHFYYRQRLTEMWMRDFTNGSSMPFTKMRSTDYGGPYHLINATVNLIGPKRNSHEEPTESFLFSSRFCGSQRVDYEYSARYSRRGSLTVADAMAISGAAISPVAAMNNLLLFYALILTNARLGQWVRNPGENVWLRYPTFLPAIYSYFFNPPEKASYLYVSDGGHHDNTGIESLLRRRCRVILACDASWDPKSQFLDLLRLFRRMTIFEGIEFSTPDGNTIDMHDLVPDEQTRLTNDHLLLVRIRYPETKAGETEFGWLIYLKSSLSGDEKPELLRYRSDNADFPHDPTTDQFFDPRRFECYRELGYHLGERLFEWLTPKESEAGKLWLKDRDFSTASEHRPEEALHKELLKAKARVISGRLPSRETMVLIGQLFLSIHGQNTPARDLDEPGARQVGTPQGNGKVETTGAVPQ